MVNDLIDDLTGDYEYYNQKMVKGTILLRNTATRSWAKVQWHGTTAVLLHNIVM